MGIRPKRVPALKKAFLGAQKAISKLKTPEVKSFIEASRQIMSPNLNPFRLRNHKLAVKLMDTYDKMRRVLTNFSRTLRNIPEHRLIKALIEEMRHTLSVFSEQASTIFLTHVDRYRRRNNLGGGDCLFLSLAQRKAPPHGYKNWRPAIVNHMTVHKKRFAP